MLRRRLSLLAIVLILFTAVAHASDAAKEGSGSSGESSEYYDIRPSIITNYGGPGPIHFLKVDVTLQLAKGQDMQAKVSHYLPLIRHQLIMLFSRQTADGIMSMPAKEKLRHEALVAIQDAITKEEGTPLVEDVLFTNFIAQN